MSEGARVSDVQLRSRHRNKLRFLRQLRFSLINEGFASLRRLVVIFEVEELPGIGNQMENFPWLRAQEIYSAVGSLETTDLVKWPSWALSMNPIEMCQKRFGNDWFGDWA